MNSIVRITRGVAINIKNSIMMKFAIGIKDLRAINYLAFLFKC